MNFSVLVKQCRPIEDNIKGQSNDYAITSTKKYDLQKLESRRGLALKRRPVFVCLTLRR